MMKQDERFLSSQTGPLTRRGMLRRSALGFGWLAAASLLAKEQSFADAALPSAHVRPRAKRVIFLFMKGGPSHVDTFDYKPKLQAEDGKPFPFEKPRVQFAPDEQPVEVALEVSAIRRERAVGQRIVPERCPVRG